MKVIVVIVGLSVLALLHELGHAAAARLCGMTVTDFSVGLGPPWRRWQWGATRVSLAVVPFGGFVRVAEMAPDALEDPRRFTLRNVSRRLAVTLAGPLSNYLVAACCGLAMAAGWGVDTGRIAGLEVTAVSTHANQSGLRPGDVLLSVDARPVTSLRELSTSLEQAHGAPVRLLVRRGAVRRELDATPLERAGRWGFGARYVVRPELREVGAAAAVAHGLTFPLSKARTVLGNAGQMLRASSAVRPLSPVGLADRVARSGQWDARRALGFAALLSVVVGLFNLLPLPGLDGGRLVIESTEAALRRRIARRVAIGIQVAGAVVLLALWLVVMLRDLLDLGS